MCNSLPSLHNYDVKWPNFNFFFWGRERQGDKFYHLCLNSRNGLKGCGVYFSVTFSWASPLSLQSRGQQLCKLLGIKEFNSHTIFFVHKHVRRFIVLYTNMAAVMSCENDLLEGARHHAHTWFCFFTSGEKTLGISSVLILKIKSFKYHDKTSCRPVRSVIILVNKQIELALRGRPILLITRVITDQIGFNTVR